MRTRVVLVLGLISAGCSTTPTIPDASKDAGNDDQGVDACAIDHCPFCEYCSTLEPAVGTSCPETGMICEYGTDSELSCNRIYSCTDAGTWTETLPGTNCPSGHPRVHPLLGSMYLQCDIVADGCRSFGGCGCPVYVVGSDCD